MRLRFQFLLGLAAIVGGLAPAVAAPAPAPSRPKLVVVIPVHGEIAEPVLYIVRRGLKEAITRRADVVVLDMNTLGGALDVALDMMSELEKFPGLTVAYVDNQAMSAGAFISAATSEIWFAPDGIIGAAAPVTETGGDIGSTMKEKLVSYLTARMRAISRDKGYRGQVISAMIDSNSELKIDGQLLKPKGELLSLTASEAMKAYGRPPQPLLGAGIAPDLNALLTKKFGHGRFTLVRLHSNWSERLAVWLNAASPVLLGLGLLALFVAFKAPGFAGFGVVGVGLLGLVFFGSHVAGLSGHEPVLFFAVGVILLLLELAFFHSAGFLGLVGLMLMSGSIVWSMADLWPNEPLPLAWSADAFDRPLLNFGLGLVIAATLGAALLRFLPRGWTWDRLTVGAVVGGSAQAAGEAPGAAPALGALVGRPAVAATALRPGGQGEIGGRRYEAAVEVGAIDAGATVVVRGRTDFGLIVERAE